MIYRAQILSFIGSRIVFLVGLWLLVVAHELFNDVMFLARLVRHLMVQRDLRRAAFLCCDYSLAFGDQKKGLNESLLVGACSLMAP